MLDISTYELLVESDGGDEVASCPQRFFFVKSVFAFDLLLQPGRGFPFQYLHGVRDRVAWRREDTEVDVVILNVQLNDFPVFPFADCLEDPPQFALDDFFFRTFPRYFGVHTR